MNKILLIIQREYLTRVRKKSFIIMSILGPLLIAVFYGIIIWATVSGGEKKSLYVLDESGLFSNKFESTSNLEYILINSSLDEAKKKYLKGDIDALLHIPKFDIQTPEGFKLFSKKGISAATRKKIERVIETEIEDSRLNQLGINKEALKSINANIDLVTVSLNEEGEEDISTTAATITGFIGGFIVYFFVFFYGVQVMRGVMEEKTSRVVEIIVSSVRPFQLMMGKIVGIAGVGLTQILIWIVLGLIISSAASVFFLQSTGLDSISSTMQNLPSSGSSLPIDNNVANTIHALETINFPLIIFSFLFFFLFGYLMYGALFGAIGAAVDSETDSQQFMLPITMPLILSIALSSAIIADPNGSLAFWLSIFPLTSPVVMMIRLPFIGFSWELLLSMTLLVGSFLGATWIAGKIYRTGILLYGKKITYKELGKWLFYK